MMRLIAAAILLACACRQLSAATVSGQIRMMGASDSSAKRRSDYSGAVVWLTSREVPLVRTATKHVQMVQKDKKFSPHILVVETGTSVDFPNLDPIFHNAFSNFNGQVFDVALYPPGSSRTVRFDRPGVVRVFCNIHPSMSAIIAVVSTDNFAVSDHDGRYTITNVTPGKYQVHFFYERATPETLEKLTETIVVGNGGYEPAPVTISEAGYLPVAHKNKYGQDYPADSDKPDAYSLPLK